MLKATLVPVMMSFVFLHGDRAEELLARRIALDKMVNGDVSFTKGEIMDLLADQLENSNFHQLRTELRARVRQAYIGHEVRLS